MSGGRGGRVERLGRKEIVSRQVELKVGKCTEAIVGRGRRPCLNRTLDRRRTAARSSQRWRPGSGGIEIGVRCSCTRSHRHRQVHA